MNTYKDLTQESKDYLINEISKSKDKLELWKQSFENGYDPKQVADFLGILQNAEWLETKKCVMVKKSLLLTKEECDTIIQNIKNGCCDSTVIGFQNVNPDRISKTKWYINMEWLDKKINDFMGTTNKYAESTQGTWYLPGGYYVKHADFFRQNNIQLKQVWDYDVRGQRTWTALLYLNTVTNGSGKTTFPHINQSIQPENGTLVAWYNLLPNGEGNCDTEHIAEKLVDAEKFICQKWYRVKPTN